MTSARKNLTAAASGFAMLFLAIGCGTETTPQPASSENVVRESSPPRPEDTPAQPTQAQELPEIPTISLSSSTAPRAMDHSVSQPEDTQQSRKDLLAAMQPLQVLLGTWRGTTQREFGQFKAVDHPVWVWDFQTDRNQPALVMTSSESPYIREGRLTYLTDQGVFQLTAIDSEGQSRTLEGTFTTPVEEFQGDDSQMHLKYKLELTQVDPADGPDQWQIVFNLQDNNRFLQEMSKRRGKRFFRVDTVATQREGTSFARSDTGYGEKECIISGGLGTIQVSYQGKSYWVCCSGCKAAFEEDPESWIAEFQKKKSGGGS